MLLIPEVLTILFLNLLFIFIATIALLQAISIYKDWDINAITERQYTLENRSYLSATIIKLIFMIKIPLFLFFIFTLDKISLLLNGAMCGAGVVDATMYGTSLFILKIINLYFFAYWLALHHEDLKHKLQPYTKRKFGFYILLYFSFLLEVILEFFMFSSFDLTQVVSCCSTLYSASAHSFFSYLLVLKPIILLTLFYLIYFSTLLFYFFRKRFFFAIANILFLSIAIVTLISFYGTYIYQLPSHHCPFCLLQSDYYYVGYLLYSILFLGTFSAILVGFIKTQEETRKKYYQYSLLFNTLYMLIVSAYPLVYFIKNGVWL